MQPFFSIIVPTKNRPKLVENAIFSLKQQNFDDFEAIVSDYEGHSCKTIFDKYADSRFKYVNPPVEFQYGMNGNWENGLRFATGRYVCFLEDKMYFYKDSLERLYHCILKTDFPDTVNWKRDIYSFENEHESLRGRLRKQKQRGIWEERDPIEEIDDKLEFSSYSIYREVSAGLGTIFSGMIKREIIEKVKQKYGRFFNFYNPDYGPTIAVLNFSKRSILLHDTFTVAMASMVGNGKATSISYEASCSFLKESLWGMNRLKYAPIPFLPITHVNLIGVDYNYSLETLPDLKKKLNHKSCNKINALVGIRLEMDKIVYPSVYEKEKSEMMFLKAIKELNKAEFNNYQNIITANRDQLEANLFRRFYDRLIPDNFKIALSCGECKFFEKPIDSMNWI